MIARRVLEGCIVAFASSSLIASLLTLTLILVRVRPLATNVPIILTCNTYVTLVGASFMTLLIRIDAVIHTRKPSVDVRDTHCQIRAFINYTFICALYYSCVLQATFRLCRVVFPSYKLLQSRGVCWLAIVVQWTFAGAHVFAYYIFGDFEYQPDVHSCWLSFTNIRALSIAMTFVYGAPLLIMALIYGCLIRHIRQTSVLQHARQSSNKRDALVVKRIIILVLVAMSMGIPSGCLLIVYGITGFRTPFSYHIQALTLTVGLFIESVALGCVTPQVRDICRRIRRRMMAVATIAHP